jgi:hypothetical protein
VAQELNGLENAVIEMLLRGDDPVLKTLSMQLRASHVTSRRYTGAGFFTNFTVPDDVAQVPGKDSFAFGDVIAEIASLQHGAGFLLFVKGGKLSILEGFSYDEPWPAHTEDFTLQCSTGDVRDFAALAREWTP